jgi:uncharacterized protein involved in type VI secretion and phage assembly
MPPDGQNISQFFISVRDNILPTEVMDALDDAVIEDDLAQPAMFALRFNDPELTLIESEIFRLGSEIKLSALDASGQRQPLLVGEITALEPLLEQQNLVLVVRGYDRSHRLHRGRKTRTFLKQSDSDIAEQIARDNGLQPDVEATGIQYDYVLQDNQTDMEFLRERAARIGYQARVMGKHLTFRQTAAAFTAASTLEWGDTLLSFRARLTVTAQPNEVHVRGWDAQAKRALVGRASRPDQPSQIGDRKSGGEVAQQSLGAPARVVLSDRPVHSQSDADHLAQAVLDALSGDYLTAEGVCYGDPAIRAGSIVAITGIGKRLGGDYAVTASRHEYTAHEGYMTTFYTSGRRPTGLLAAFEQTATRHAMRGVVSGIVTNINDPEKLGRVKLAFPWLDETHESDWARVATPGAGKSRGFSVMPEIDDEVLVAFEHGDISRPYVIGGLWNSKDTPPVEVVQGGQVQVRTLQTRTGQRIAFDDTDGSGKIEIASNKHTITLDDGGIGNVVIESCGDLELKGPGGTFRMTRQGVELSANARLTLKAGGDLTIQGALVKIN